MKNAPHQRAVSLHRVHVMRREVAVDPKQATAYPFKIEAIIMSLGLMISN